MRDPNKLMSIAELEAEAAEQQIIRAAYVCAGICYCVACYLMYHYLFVAAYSTTAKARTR